MSNPIVLFRESLSDPGELGHCQKFFRTTDLRTECKDSLVISRYSCLPYYEELESDLLNLGSGLINSYEQHRWIANFEWYWDLKEHTPKTWTDNDFYRAPQGKYIVKGRTNSKKAQWNTHMYASNKKEALCVASMLLQDSFIGPQGVVYREYIPLKTFEVGINGIPFTNEHRFFFYKTIPLTWGYYWDCAENTSVETPNEAFDFACEVAKIVSEHVNFFALDIAETKEGEWILIEVNDGQMSGLSVCPPDCLYRALKAAIRIL